MIRVLFQPRPLWINVNIALFSGYAIFGIASFFLPSPMRLSWFFALHVATLLVNIYVVYGLATMRHSIYFLVAVISLLMAAHLFIFLFVPLGMLFAYIGPSRAFYAGLLALASRSVGEKGVTAVLAVFNLAMLLIQIVNACYFKKKAETAAKA
jgi:hypothetical protein